MENNNYYNKLKNLLIKANKAYYIDSNPIMSDYEFDMKLKELEAIEKEQGFSDSDSPTRSVGSDINNYDNKSNKHKRPMLSLENTFSIEDITKWYSDMIKLTGKKNLEVVVNPKWDGGSCANRYSNGIIKKALTRGDGEIGEDITENVSYLATNIWPIKNFSGEARGELIMTNSGFDILNTNGKYQNARNLLSGSMKLLDKLEFSKRSLYIRFYAYWLEDSKNKTYLEDLRELEKYFTVGPYYLCNSVESIIEAIEKIRKDSKSFEVAIDGAVLKLNDKTLWEKIGSTSKFPRWARAFKYKQESIKSKVTKIEFWVGRTGKITPVCWFEPKKLDGSTIQKATLNNKDFYTAMDVAINDIVEVQKAAAIIPQIISVEKSKDRKIIKFPTVCPCCGSPLKKHNDEHADYFCDNDNCQSRIVGKIINYTHSLEIDGFADIIVERLFENGFLSSIADLYNLKNHIEEISKLNRLSKDLAKKLCNNIEKSKNCEFWKVISGFGIPGVGPKTSKELANHFKNIDNLQNATIEDLISLKDIAEITADSIYSWFNDPANKSLISKLKLENQKLHVDNNLAMNNNVDLLGKKFCITGVLSQPRSVYVKLIESNNGKIVNSVSKATDYLVTNDQNSGSSKNLAAKKLGIPILNETELLKLCKTTLSN